MLSRQVILVAVLVATAVMAPRAVVGGPVIMESLAASTPPYPAVNGGAFSGREVGHSPDLYVKYRWPQTFVDSDKLQSYELRAVKASVKSGAAENFDGLESAVSGQTDIHVTGGGEVLFDFGRENPGWFEIDSPDLEAALATGQFTVTMAIGEYDDVGIYNGPGPNPEHPIKQDVPVKAEGTTWRLVLNKEWYEGVRFGILTVTPTAENTAGVSFRISAVRLVSQIMPVNYDGYFASGDNQLDSIWYTAIYTVRTNLGPGGFGAILIDRSDRISWTGDAHTSQMAALAAFGAFRQVRDNIVRTHGPAGYNGIESYAMYWILSVCDYYQKSGDHDFFVKFADEIETKLSHARAIYGTNPSLSFYGSDDRVGADFEDPSCPESQRAYMGLVIRVHQAAAAAAAAAGITDYHNKWQTAADGCIKALLATPDWSAQYGMHAAAEAMLGGFVSEPVLDSFKSELFSDPVQICSFSPFNNYFIIRAMWAAGMRDEAVAAVRRCWGGMLDLGATSFWETYSPEWNSLFRPNEFIPNGPTGYTSMCHPWASGVAVFMSDVMLGVAPVQPGYAQFEVKPALMAGTTYSGAVPTQHGLVEVTASASNTSMVVVTVQWPRDATAGRVVLPSTINGCAVTGVTLNGQKVWAPATMWHRLRPTTAGADGDIVIDLASVTTSAPAVVVAELKCPGSDVSRIVPIAHRDVELTYAGAFVKSDSTTAGAWHGVYGADAAVLFGTHSVKQLSTGFVSDIQWHAPTTVNFAPVNTTDPRAPAPLGGGERSVGALSSNNPAPCQQSITLDITTATPGKPYTAALYFVDWDSQSRDIVIEPRDLATKNIVAPFQRVQGFSGGVYYVFKYDRSARFRINFVRGGNAMLAAAFIDSAAAV